MGMLKKQKQGKLQMLVLSFLSSGKGWLSYALPQQRPDPAGVSDCESSGPSTEPS